MIWSREVFAVCLSGEHKGPGLLMSDTPPGSSGTSSFPVAADFKRNMWVAVFE